LNPSYPTSLDAKEAIKASQSLLAVWYDDGLKPLARPIILSIGEGKVTLEVKGERGKAEIPAETSGEVKVAMQGNRFLQALKACSGIVEMQTVSATSPVLFTVDSHRCVVMPMDIEETKAEAQAEPKGEPKAEAEGKPKRKRKAKAERKAQAEAEAIAQAEAEAQAIAEPETPITKAEAREAVAVA